MTLHQEALQFIEHLGELYFKQRNMAEIFSLMQEDSSCIGTGALEIWHNLNEAKAALSLKKQEYNGSFTVTRTDFDIIPLSDSSCVVYGEIVANPDDAAIADIYYRMTAVCVKTDFGIKLAHIHMSMPALEQENSPGGMHQCKCDKELTLVDMSKSFLSLVGYTKREIKELFQNRFAQMIYPPDLQKVTAELERQLGEGSGLELEYRICHSDGRLIWILDHGRKATTPDGGETFYCMLMDITKQKQEQDQLRLSLERHRIIMDQTTDILFEWDIEKDTLDFSSNWRKKFGYEPASQSISHMLPQSPNIHPEDMKHFVKLMEDTAIGVPYSEAEFRIRDILGKFAWYKIRATVQYDSQRRPIKAIGVIMDIDADKKQRQQLLDQAQRDALTNLYNKSAVRELAIEKMSENNGDKEHALLIIDVDDFKRVNDVYGHLCGDSLLSDVASILKNQFRKSDLVGRIGGDEFLVYLPEVAGEKGITAKIQMVLDELRKLRPSQEAAPISCSIGIALFPQKSVDYFLLYKCADLALYRIKAQGKNNFLFYNPDDFKSIVDAGISGSAVGGIDSETESIGDSVGEKLAQYTFRMLYNSIDVNTAVGHLLEIVGRAYDVSRVYIFESSEDGERCSNTFEWCNTGVESEMENLQSLSYKEDLGNYLTNFDEKGIFYCGDIRELNPDLFSVLSPQGICSLLQCAIMDDGVFKGYVGFDECRENRSWTANQISSLSLISNVLSTFLLKLRLKEQLDTQ